MSSALRWILGLLLPVTAGVVLYVWLQAPHVRPNVLLITVDTLRADHLGIYGYTRPTSPTIDALARRGVVFDRAFAQSSLSGPSHATMMTSLHTAVHGAINNTVVLRDENLTLAEILHASGYETGMLVSHPFVGPEYGFDQGFDTAATFTVAAHHHLHDRDDTDDLGPIGAVFDRAVEWLREPRDKPFFLWIHSQHPHESYEPPPPYDRMFGEPPVSEHDLRCMHTLGDYEDGEIELDDAERAHVVNLYDGEIAYVDRQVGRLLEALQATGAQDTTLVVLTADHGEMLLDDPTGRVAGHGRYRFDSVLRVPFILAGPGVGVPDRRIDSLVGLIDLAPTVLDLAGVRAPESFDGTSLAPMVKGGSDHEIRSTNFTSTFHTDGTIRLSARSTRSKLICERRHSEMACRLYDLERDPGETTDVAADPAHASELKTMTDSLESWFDRTVEQGRLAEIDPPNAQALKLLKRAGYLRDDEP